MSNLEGRSSVSLSLLPSFRCNWLPCQDSPTKQRLPKSLAKITLSSTAVRGLARHGQGRKTEGRGVRMGSFAGQMTYTTFWLPVSKRDIKAGGGGGGWGAGWESLFQELYPQLGKGAGGSTCQGFQERSLGVPA